MGELKRVFNYKMCIMIGIGILLNLCLFFYEQLEGRSMGQVNFSNEQYDMLLKRYSHTELNDALEQVTIEKRSISRYTKSLTEENNQNNSLLLGNTDRYDTQLLLDGLDENSLELIHYYQGLSLDEQRLFELELGKIKNKLTALSSYKSNIKSIQVNAEKLKIINIFSDKHAFAYNNILKTAADFKRVNEVDVALDHDRGVDAFVHYYFQYYIIAALIMVIIYAFFQERENGIWTLLHGTAFGRTRFAIKRFFIVIGSSCALLALFYISTFLFSMCMYGGWSSLSHPIQTLNDFGKFTYPLNKLEYVFVLYGVSAAILSALGLVVWSVFTFFRNRNHALICLAVFVGSEILIYQKIGMQSVYNAFHYINVVSFLRINELLSTYLNWGVNTHVFSVLFIVSLGLTVLTILCVIFAIVKYSTMHPQIGVTILEKIANSIHSRYQRLFSMYPVLSKEIHKLIITGKGIWVIVSVIIITIYFSATGTMSFVDLQKETDIMYLEHGGKEYSYITNYTNEIYQEYEEAQAQLMKKKELYDSGEIDMKTYASAVSEVQFKQYTLQRVKEFKDREAYIEQVKNKYNIDAWMISDRGYEEIFGQYSQQRELIILIALITGVMFIVSESISLEQRTGMQMMIHSSSNGRLWISIRKLWACIIFTIVFTWVIYAVDIGNLYRIYGMPYLNAPALSLTFLEGTAASVIPKITIIGWMVLRLIVRTIAALLTMAAAILVSKVIAKKGSRAVMLVALVILIVFILLLQKYSFGI